MAPKTIMSVLYWTSWWHSKYCVCYRLNGKLDFLLLGLCVGFWRSFWNMKSIFSDGHFIYELCCSNHLPDITYQRMINLDFMHYLTFKPNGLYFAQLTSNEGRYNSTKHHVCHDVYEIADCKKTTKLYYMVCKFSYTFSYIFLRFISNMQVII